MSSQAGKSEGQKSRLSEMSKERLLDIQKREQLKGLLINKFKLKYGNKPNVAAYINNEVNKFLKNDRLTEENLQKLDDKINKESQIRDKQEVILDDKRSEKQHLQVPQQANRPQTQASKRISTASVINGGGLDKFEEQSQKSIGNKSVMSGASKLSKQSDAKPRLPPKRDYDALSVTSSKRPLTEAYSEIDEEDEWTAILKFNTLLHYEEQKQNFLKEQERKRLIKIELEKQLKEKEYRKKKEKDEDKMYEQIQNQHIKLLDEREKLKHNEMRNKIMTEKESRDKQLQEEKLRRRKEQKEQFEQEVELVNKLHQEIDQERQVQNERRNQEKEYLQRMLQENEKNQKKMKIEREKEKQADIQAQHEYTRMLDKQEQDRFNEFKAREKRAQEFMNKMADTVIKQMDQRQNEEDKKITKYEMEKEMRERMEDERRFSQLKDSQQDMKRFLFRQLDDKKHREQMEKSLNDEQAVMWKQDKANYEEEERRLMEKIKKINLDNADFLKKQAENKLKKERAKMNRQEFLLNKPILREINQKKKGESQHSGSLRGVGDDYQKHI